MRNARSRSGTQTLGRLGALVVAVLLGSTLLAVAPSAPARAITGSEFNPGLIIADSLFYDGAAMTESQIQQFLASKGSALAGYSFSVESKPRSLSTDTGRVRCEAFQGGTLSAATILFRAQQSCGISAKVLLVTLQKEQGLITKTAPSQSALDRAMGYACPDTAPCAPTTLGFGNQVYNGSRQFNTYRAANFGRQPGWHAIQYHPNAACGASSVLVQNYATAALYNYTPYQPNAAALANLGGTGDSCSSYGNRNFWVYYNSWFGSTLGSSIPFPFVPPTVAGTSQVGTTLTAQVGSWSGAPTSFGYVWLVCTTRPSLPFSTLPTGCSIIQGVSGQSYVSTAGDVGKFIAVVVTGANGYGAMAAGGVMSVPIGTPVNLSPPTVSGIPAIGSTWTVNPGAWAGTPTPTLLIFWLRCSQPISSLFGAVPSSCEVITGANAHTYVVTSADLGKYLTAQVAGNSPLGFSLAGATSTVAVGFPVNLTLPTVSGSASVGSTWRVNPGSWTGNPTPEILIFWLRCNQPMTSAFTVVPPACVVIPGANGTSYVSTMADAGKYLTAQVAGNSSRGFSLAGATNATAIQAALPANTVPPTVSGAAAVGSTWTVNAGTWTGSPTPTTAIFWLRCNQPMTSAFTVVPAACVVISGANGSSYVATSQDAGKYLTAQVAGSNALGFSLAGATNATAIQAALPANTVPPTVSGAAAVGSTWTVNAGTWTGSPTPTTAIFWLRCNQPMTSAFTVVPAACVVISGANGSSYVATSQDAGKYLTAQVAGSNALGFSLAGATNATAIQAALPANTVPPTVSGAAAVGSTWTVNAGTWTGSPTPTTAIFWLRCNQPMTSAFTVVPAACVVISGANGSSYVATSQDAGKYLTAQVAGSNALGFSLAGATNATAIQSALPANTVPPTVSGAAAVGSTWTVNAGTWTGSPTPTTAIHWLRCNQPVSARYSLVPSGCIVITGATTVTYVSTAADVGKYLTAQVAGNSPLGFTIVGATNTIATS